MSVVICTTVIKLPAPTRGVATTSPRRGRGFLWERGQLSARKAYRIAGASVRCMSSSAGEKATYGGAYRQFLDQAWRRVGEKANGLVKFPDDAFTHMHAPGRDGGEALHIYGQAGQANALRYLRTLVIDQGPQLQVFNCCFFPDPAYDLPAFGADFVTMPRGSLAALDFQPLGNRPATVEAYVSRLQPLRARFHTAFPEGGPMPAEATEFFSAAKIWTRFGNAAEVLPTLLQAFEAYLEAYVSLVNSTPPLRDPAEVDRLREGQHRYLSYRAEKVATLSLLPVSCTYGALSALLPACLSVYRMGCFFVGDATGQAWGFQPPATFSCLRLLPRFLL
eukprot:jgi/Mesvir1/22785/Mv14174-RA.1